MKTLPYILLIVIAFAVGCNDDNEGAATDSRQWSKTMIYSIDQDKTFFEDQEDEDFSEYSAMFYSIVQEVYNGELQAYEYWTGDPISADSAKKMLNVIDSVYATPDEGHQVAQKVVVINYEEDIPSVKIKERWHWNAEKKELAKKVIAIAPRIPVYSRQTGELRGYSPLFWIFLDKEEEKEYVKKNKRES